MKPPTVIDLTWERDLILSGTSGNVSMTLDSASVAGPSPMQALAFALAGCMAMDVIHILTKGRHDFRALRVELNGARSPEDPRRFTELTLRFAITGAVAPETVERAVRLSRETYCSVWHSMRQDVPLTVSFAISAE